VQRHQRVLLFKSLPRLSIGTAYAAWTGIGSVGVVIGMALFDDSVTAVRIGCIVLIVTGVFGRRLAEADRQVPHGSAVREGFSRLAGDRCAVRP
jgi:hypothetical protein